MTRYFAQVDGGIVQRVVVCEDPGWLTERLGGTWIETSDPYAAEPGEVAYCGPGFGHDPEWAVRFAPRWQQPAAPDEDGRWPYNIGSITFDAGRLWVSTVDANVQPPGVANWRNIPTTPGRPPVWVQPSGSQDTFQTGEHVLHPDEQGDEYESLIDNNTTTPGSDDRWWRKVTEPSESGGTEDGSLPNPYTWTVGDSYAIGDHIVHQGVVYVLLQNHTAAAHWPPDAVASIYQPV